MSKTLIDFLTANHLLDTRRFHLIHMQKVWNHLQQQLDAANKEVKDLKSGHRGACYACEPVGELNEKLEAELKRERDKNAKTK